MPSIASAGISSVRNNLCICGLRKNVMSLREFDYNSSFCTLHCAFSINRNSSLKKSCIKTSVKDSGTL